MAPEQRLEGTPIVEIETRGRLGRTHEVAPGIVFFPYFGNVIAFLTDEGVVLVDASSYASGAQVLQELREITDIPVHTIIYTHGHLDHAPGANHFIEDARQRGHPRPRVVGQRQVVDRLHRYERMARQTWFINSIQWARRTGPSTEPPPQPPFTYPDVLYDERMTLVAGGEPFELRAGVGETDDATWVWAPKRSAVCAGDFFVGACPNIGNPWKVQRYAEGWAEALEAMAGLHPELLLPGHGPVYRGADTVQTVLLDTARYVRCIAEQVIERMNKGQWLEQILREVEPPPELAAKPYLQPVYGHPKFVVHGVWRQYGGWYDGNPANFFPAPTLSQAEEIVGAAGAEKLLARARELQSAGDLALACHIVDWVTKAEPENRSAWGLCKELYEARAAQEVNMMARHTFKGAAREAERRLS
jgi:alkyl sulfatase BDS1-like metallo-beta-lactamase superfamily hydrolase